MINRKKTYENIRKEFGALNQKQVDGFEAMFNEWDARGLNDIRFLSYMLATVWHEVRETMQPIEEDGRGKGKAYEGNYYGRGLVQLTWLVNYKKATAKNKKGWNFVLYPELALEMEPAIWICFEGMLNGWFTGKKLSDYFGVNSNNPKSARRIINGLDRSDLIAGYYEKFKKCLL